MLFIHWKKPDGGTASTSVSTAEWEATLPDTKQISEQLRQDYAMAMASELQDAGTVPAIWVMQGVFDAPPSVDIAELRKQQVERIDARAASIYSGWARFDTEHALREQDALAFKAASFKGDAGIYVSSFASVTGKSEREAAEAILVQADTLRQARSEMAVLRMRKYELAKANNRDELLLQADAIVAAMNEVAKTLT